MPPILVAMRNLVYLLTLKRGISGSKFFLPVVSCLLVVKYDSFSCSLTLPAPYNMSEFIAKFDVNFME